MGAQSPGTVLFAGGATPAEAHKDLDCQAFIAAVKRWCGETCAHKKKIKDWEKSGKPPPRPPFVPQGRKFNDYFFQETTSAFQDAAREVPLGVTQAGGGVMSMTELARSNSPAGEAAEAMLDRYEELSQGLGSGGSGWDGLRHNLNREFQGTLGNGSRPFYPDGMRDGTAIEIKGPGDREGPNQFQKYADTAPDKKCVVIGPKGCDPAGNHTTPGGRCKCS